MKDIIRKARRELAERLAGSDFQGWGYRLDEWCYDLAVKVSPDRLIGENPTGLGVGWQEMGYMTDDDAGSPFRPFDQTDVEPFRSALAAHVDELTQRIYSAFPPVPEAFRAPDASEKTELQGIAPRLFVYDEAQEWRSRWGHPDARTVDEIAATALHPPTDDD